MLLFYADDRVDNDGGNRHDADQNQRGNHPQDKSGDNV
jgi:hypothetical protein